MKRIKIYSVNIRALSIALVAMLWFGTNSLNAQSGKNLFNYVKSPLLTKEQQHYAEEQLKSAYNLSHTYLTISAEEFRGNSLNVTLPGGKQITVTKQELNDNAQGTVSWKGVFENPQGNADFVVNGNMITGRIACSEFVYSLMPIGNGMHILLRINSAAFPNDETEDGYRNMLEQGIKNTAQKGSQIDPETGDPVELLAGDCKIRVLVVFTDDVQAALADPKGFVQSCIDVTNTANTQSLVNFQIELARSMELSYAETGNSTTDKTNFRNSGDGQLDAVHNARIYYDADLCCLVVNSLSNACGEAWTVAVSPYADAFCVVDRTCAVSNFSFPHELAHLYGCRHDPAADNTNTPYAYGHGFVNAAQTWRTIMAYPSSCGGCTRLGYWSNPGVSYGGVAMGTLATHDNESAHESSRTAIAGLETPLSAKVFPAETIGADQNADIIATTSVTNSGDYIMESSSTTTWRAGSDFIMTPGFWAKSGSQFQTLFDNCSALFAKNSAAETNKSLVNPSASDIIVQPNPFKDEFQLVYVAEKPGKVNIEIYNMLGERMRELMEQNLEHEGLYRFDFNVSNVEPGIYFCTVRSESSTKTIRVIKQ